MNLSSEQNMDPRINKLINAFQQKGWALNGSADISSDWWFSDIIQLCSTWRPVNKEIYLTLLTDPQVPDRKIVWSIGISLNIPNNRQRQFIDQIALNDIHHTDLISFVENINKTVLV